MDSSGNETTTSGEIVSYKVTGICESVDANKYLSIRIPEKYRNFQVTMIKSKAFYNLNNIYKVIIPDTITKYGDNIFGKNTNLKYAEINGSGRGYYNFMGCTNLEKVVLGNGVALSLRWFSGCTNLREVILNGKISIISTDYFEYCDNLTTITLAQENKSYKFIDDALYSYDESQLILCLPKKQGEYIIPSIVSEVGLGAVNNTRNN